MKMFAALLIAGLLVAGALVVRHQKRVTASPVARPPVATETRDLKAANAWQQGIRLDIRADYNQLDPAVREALRREEARQRPQEGRN